jgi:autonomous glycyl radical cofactor GrcA
MPPLAFILLGGHGRPVPVTYALHKFHWADHTDLNVLCKTTVEDAIANKNAIAKIKILFSHLSILKPSFLEIYDEIFNYTD